MSGSRERKLKKGDLVVIDIGCGVEGYHTDKTLSYMFGKAIPDEVMLFYERCVDIEEKMKIASFLKPGAIPSGYLFHDHGRARSCICVNFMGYGAEYGKIPRPRDRP